MILANNSTLNLPNAGQADTYPVIINASVSCVLTVSGTLIAANRGNFTSSGLTLGAGTRWRVTKVSASTWFIEQLNHNAVGAGNFSRYTATITGTTTLSSSQQLTGGVFTLIGATLTITAGFGFDTVFIGGSSVSTIQLSSGVFTLPDKTTTSTLTLQTDDVVHLIGRITGTSGLTVQVVTQASTMSRSSQYSAPTTGQTITSNPDIGDLTHVIEPAGTIAALTINLPANPKNGNKVTYVAVQAVTAVTIASGTVVGAPAGFTAGQKYTLSYNTAQNKWL